MTRRVVQVAGALGVVALLAGGCMPAPASEQAKSTSQLYSVFFVAGAFVWLLVVGLATFAAIRYRQRGNDAHIPRQVRGSLRIEAIWTGIPIIAVLVLFALSIMVLNVVEARSPDPGVDLKVTAFRWGWTFEYPAQGISIVSSPTSEPDVVVPVGVPIHVAMTSVDVNHAFFVPQFLFKRDAIPSHPTTFDFTVSAPGRYPGTCAEFCGVYHWAMRFAIKGVSQADFEAWAAAQPKGPASGAPSAGSGAPAAPGSASASPSPGGSNNP
ncbi:MAG TPA: cytochrome c oxidase subunit II [Candidatus Limnocylindrales bacterium]